MLGTIQGAIVSAVPPASIVWPSGSARTTALPAIVPPAPPRFSTTIGWPSSVARGSNTARGTRSVALPAAKGMKARNGLVGQVCATLTAVEATHARIASAIRILCVIISPIMLLHARGFVQLTPTTQLALRNSKQSGGAGVSLRAIGVVSTERAIGPAHRVRPLAGPVARSAPTRWRPAE